MIGCMISTALTAHLIQVIHARAIRQSRVQSLEISIHRKASIKEAYKQNEAGIGMLIDKLKRQIDEIYC